MRKVAAPPNDDVGFGEQEFPTRRSDVNLVDYAREAEVLLANGLEVDSAQMLRATIAPPSAVSDVPLDATLRVAASAEEIEWFPLADEASALLRILTRPASVREALERAGLTLDEGVEHVRRLVELGLVALS